MRVLELLAKHDTLTVSQTATHLGSNRASAHRFLATLRDLGYVEKNEENCYRLTFRILELATTVVDRFDIRREARSYMQVLAKEFNETVNLGFWDGMEILHLDKIDSSEILRMDAPYWSKTPAYCTALGKAILANLPADELESYLDSVQFTPHGPNTILSTKDLRDELEKIAADGYAVDDEELTRDLRCVAAPIFDHTARVQYAMSISAPTIRMTMEKVELVQEHVKSVCQQLSKRLGGRFE